MIELSTVNKEIKNRLEDTGAWIVFLTLSSPDNSIVIRICTNTEDQLFKGQTYTAFPFKLGEIKETNKGEIPSASIIISNVERVVQSYIEQDVNKGSGWEAVLDICHSDNLASPEISYNFITNGVSADEETVTLSCELKNPIRHKFPRIRMLPNSCQNRFKQGGCTYSGTDTSCEKTLSACREKFLGSKKIPFLGFPGIPTSGIYV